MTIPIVEFHKYRVSVEVEFPRQDWLTRLVEGESTAPHCSVCDRVDVAEWIYLNTECLLRECGADLPDGVDSVMHPRGRLLFCSWACVLTEAAQVVAIAGEELGQVEVGEIPDWRAGQ